VKDIFVRPSGREKKVDVTGTSGNAGGMRALEAIHKVEYECAGERKTIVVPPEEKEVPAHGTADFTFTIPGEGLKLWSIEEPNLCTLTVTTKGKAKETVRFGYRELWAEGPDLFLNGVKIHMNATSCHPFAWSKEDAIKTFRKIKEMNCPYIRLHAQPWPKWWYEAADEVGVLVVWESAYWCLANSYLYGEPEFWENYRRHLEGQIKLHRNHPSIVIWSLENEQLHCGGAENFPKLEEKLAEMGRFTKKLDPTRLIMYEADEDPGGVADIINLHYPCEYPRRLYPNECWWPEKPRRPDSYPPRVWEWNRRKPLYIGEYLWVSAKTPDGHTVWFGDKVYENFREWHWAGKAEAWNYQIEAYRALGIHGCPWNIFEGGGFDKPMAQVQAVKYDPITLFLREKNRRFYAGQQVKRTLYVFNDTFEERRFELSRKTTFDEQVEDLGPLKMTPARIKKIETTWKFPEPVEAPRKGRITYTIDVRKPDVPFEIDSRIEKAFEVVVFPRRRASTDSEKVRIVSRFALKSAKELSIGEVDPTARGLLRFAEKGGRVIVLEQDRYPAGMLGLHLSAHEATVAHIRAPNHPIVKGLDPDWLKFWGGDCKLIRWEIQKYCGAPLLPIVDVGSVGGLRGCGVAEIRVGKGIIIFCQLKVASKRKEEPAAEEIMRRMIEYAEKYEPPPKRKLWVVGEKRESVSGTLRELGIGFRHPEAVSDVPAGDVLLVCAVGADAEAIAGRAKEGCTVVLHAAEAPGLLPESMAIVPAKITGAQLSRDSALTDGISAQELYWPAPEKRPTHFFMPHETFEAVADHVVRPAIKGEKEGEVPAKDFAVAEENPVNALRDDIYIFATGGTVSAKATFAKSGRYHLAVEAGGSAAFGELPIVEFGVDGKHAGAAALAQEDFSVVGVTVELKEGEHEVTINFANDAYNPPDEDRNLYVRRFLWIPCPEVRGWKELADPPVLAEVPLGKGRVIVDLVNWDRTEDNAQKAGFYLRTLLGNLGVRAEWKQSWSLPLADFEVKEGPLVRKQKDVVWFYSFGTIETEADFAKGGDYIFRVVAGGTPAEKVWPEFALLIDGKMAGKAQLKGGGPARYEIPAKVEKGKHRIGIAFTNDHNAPPEDRNLALSAVTVVRD
jgi:hypothetical protein